MHFISIFYVEYICPPVAMLPTFFWELLLFFGSICQNSWPPTKILEGERGRGFLAPLNPNVLHFTRPASVNNCSDVRQTDLFFLSLQYKGLIVIG